MPADPGMSQRWSVGQDAEPQQTPSRQCAETHCWLLSQDAPFCCGVGVKVGVRVGVIVGVGVGTRVQSPWAPVTSQAWPCGQESLIQQV